MEANRSFSFRMCGGKRCHRSQRSGRDERCQLQDGGVRAEGGTEMKARTELPGAQRRGRGPGGGVGPEDKWSWAQDQSESKHRGKTERAPLLRARAKRKTGEKKRVPSVFLLI